MDCKTLQQPFCQGNAMKNKTYYSSGEFARMAHVTLRTIRYYDQKNILKPSRIGSGGARLYSEEDFARLQQILLLKYLGFSLEDIREMTVGDGGMHFMQSSLNIQLKLVRDRIEQLSLVEKAIQNTSAAIGNGERVDWKQLLELIDMDGMDERLKNQYLNASNISARIDLHRLYSLNKKGWFPWIFEHCELKSGMRVLELGCGDGTLWADKRNVVPGKINAVLSDISEGMLRDARRRVGESDKRFEFRVFSCENIPFADSSFDLVIANHVLFYCNNIELALSEISRVLKPGGRLLCSTYGQNHMKEISRLVSDFDPHIVLAAECLYERFGRENGAALLSNFFKSVRWSSYEDSLLIPDAEPLILYIMSCHGNQSQYIVDKFSDFRAFVKKHTDNGFIVTKDAGLFICNKCF